MTQETEPKPSPKRQSRSDGFGRYSRFYELPDGTRLPSVTTILNAVNKPALVPWAAKTEREMILQAAGDLWEDVPTTADKMSRMAYLGTLQNRVGKEKANRKILAKASEIGTEIHKLAEWTLRKELQQEVGPRPKACDAAAWGFMAWEDWRASVNMVPLLIEQTCWSNKHGFAGTFDLYCEMDLPEKHADGTPTGLKGRGRVVTDWKSGKAIYTEARLQGAAYVEALIEMEHTERGTHGLIVRVPKVTNDPAFETAFITAKEQTRLFKVFLHCLELWKWLDGEGAL
jgi:hypothetical protein